MHEWPTQQCQVANSALGSLQSTKDTAGPPKEGRWEEGWCRIEERKATAMAKKGPSFTANDGIEETAGSHALELSALPTYSSVLLYNSRHPTQLLLLSHTSLLVLSLSKTCRGPHR